MNPRLSVSQSACLRDFPFAPAYPIKKVTLREGSKTDEGVAKDKVFAGTGKTCINEW